MRLTVSRKNTPWTRPCTTTRRRITSGRPDLCDELLLVEAGVLAGRVHGRDGRRVGELAARVGAEVVADECAVRADAAGMRRRELRIPRLRGEPDVVPERLQAGAVEL